MCAALSQDLRQEKGVVTDPDFIAHKLRRKIRQWRCNQAAERGVARVEVDLAPVLERFDANQTGFVSSA